MSFFKKKQSHNELKVPAKCGSPSGGKENKNNIDDDCPMCHIPDEIINQLKKDGDTKQEQSQNK